MYASDHHLRSVSCLENATGKERVFPQIRRRKGESENSNYTVCEDVIIFIGSRKCDIGSSEEARHGCDL